jgi:hypothetical protein
VSPVLSFVQREMAINTANDRDGSGGMRKSGYDVHDAGDASNTEIGHVAYLSSRTAIAITHHVCDLAESGASSGTAGIWGKDSRGPNGLSLRTAATAMPNQTRAPCKSSDH